MSLPPPAPIAPPRPPGAIGAVPAAQPVPAALGGPVFAKAPPKRLKTFSYTLDEVESAAMDLLAHLPEPKKLELDESKEVTSMLYVCDKDGKTVNALAVHTSHCMGLPRPEGSIVTCVYFDNQSESSFSRYLETSGVTLRDDGEMPFFISMRKPKLRFRGLVDPEDPANGAYIVDVFREVLRRLGERRDVGLHVTDHYGLFLEQRGNDYAMFRGGTDKMFDKNSSPDWNARSKMFEGVDMLQQSVPVPGGFFVATGYENQRDGEEKTVVKKDGSRVREVVPEKWVGYVRPNYPVIIRGKVKRDEDFRPVQWVGHIQTGRSRFFDQKWPACDLTLRHVGAFYNDHLASKNEQPSTLSPQPSTMKVPA